MSAELEGRIGVFEFNSKAYTQSERVDFAHRRPEINKIRLYNTLFRRRLLLYFYIMAEEQKLSV